MKGIISAKYSQSITYIPDPKKGWLLKNPLIKKKKAINEDFNSHFHISNFQLAKNHFFLSKANRICKSRSKVLAAIISAGNYWKCYIKFSQGKCKLMLHHFKVSFNVFLTTRIWEFKYRTFTSLPKHIVFAVTKYKKPKTCRLLHWLNIF